MNIEHRTSNIEQNVGPHQRDGILFVISAPSGAGKTTLCKEIIDFFPQLGHSVSYTTRAMRPGEEQGRDYHFVSPETFQAMVDNKEFAEWAEVHGNRYGTALSTLEEFRNQGVDVLLDIDCQGAAQLKKNYDRGVFVFILPPSYEELRRRLEGRQTDSSEVIERRLVNARDEVGRAGEYDYVVVNDDFATAFEQFKAIFLAEGCRTARILPTLKERFDI